MQAITVRKLAPTDRSGARLIAKAQAGRITVPWDHALGYERNHVEAARQYVMKFGWSGAYSWGVLPDGVTFVFVFAETRETL